MSVIVRVSTVKVLELERNEDLQQPAAANEDACTLSKKRFSTVMHKIVVHHQLLV